MKKLSVVVLALAFVCCAKGRQPTSQQQNLAGSVSPDAYPLAGGGCYLVSVASDRVLVRYLKGAEAVSVGEIRLSDEDGLYPLADGGAYLVGRRGRDTVVYYLAEAKAREVAEVNTLASLNQSRGPVPGGFAWATLQAQRTRAAKEAHEKADYEEEARGDAEHY